MPDEILINVTTRETRVALVESGMLQELQIERGWRRGVVGNIYKGRVRRVMPGMQAAFVDIGLERAAFLHASDAMRQTVTLTSANQSDESVHLSTVQATTPIVELLHDGQDVIVQVVKDLIGSKGVRLTRQLSIPSRYLVLLPQSQVVGVSSRIEDDEERTRLKNIVSALCAEQGQWGCIIRTNAEGQSAEALADDMAYLLRVWTVVERRSREVQVHGVIYEDLSLPLRALRDLVGKDTEKVKVDEEQTYHQVQAFVAKYMPALRERVELYRGDRPIFELYGVEDEIGKAFERHVPLKSGGYVVIDQTEAMTTIDVNTGSFLGQRTLEETVFRTNLEAAQTVARQLRIRNLGGIIVIDFIDMDDADHRRQVLRMLEKSLARDHAKTTVYDFSPLGLVEMTRKRTVESLERQVSEICPECSGRGTIKTAETVIYEIFREITRAVRQFDADRLLVIASSTVVARMSDEESVTLAELEDTLGKSIRFQADEQYRQEQYDVVLL